MAQLPPVQRALTAPELLRCKRLTKAMSECWEEVKVIADATALPDLQEACAQLDEALGALEVVVLEAQEEQDDPVDLTATS